MSDVPAGTTRYVVKSKFGMGRDFEILDEGGQRAFFIDGKFGVAPLAEIQDAQGALVNKVEGKLLGIPRKMTIYDASGTEVANLKAKAFSMLKNRIELEMADGEQWHLEGDFIEKEYQVTSGDRVIIVITQKWMTVRDSYTIDIAHGTDVGVALALMWAVDQFTEKN